jgi:hypothetical protein
MTGTEALTPVADNPAPADKGLVTVAYTRSDFKHLVYSGSGFDHLGYIALTPTADAEREIAVRDERMAVIRGARNYWRGRAETAEARVKELEAERDNLVKQLAVLLTVKNTIEANFAALREEALRVIKPFASVRYMGGNAFNRADLSDDDFRAARHFIQTMDDLDARKKWEARDAGK